MLAATSRILLRFSIRRSAWALVLLYLLASAPAAVLAQTAVDPTGPGSDGATTATAFQITEIGNLVWMQQRAAANQTTGKYYALMNDIAATVTATWNDAATTTATLEGFQPIGTYSLPDTTSFRGILNGNGHKILGLTINRPTTDYVGLFGSIGTNGAVRNLALEGGAVTGNSSVGAVAGGTYASAITGCSSTGAVAGASTVGGLVGYHYYHSTMTNCSASGLVTGSSRVGGLVGFSDYSATIGNCCSTAIVTGSQYVGGLAGTNGSATISNCYAGGSVKGSLYVGGLAGVGSGTISNCCTVGPVTGALSGAGSYTGGLVGIGDLGSTTACFWDMQATGQTYLPGTSGKTTAQMKRQATFVAWNFSTVWGIVENQTYPYLLSFPPPFHLDITIQGNGTVGMSPGTVDYAPGAVVTLVATPAGGNVFVGWTGPVLDTRSLATTITMDGHKSAAALFEPAYEIRTLSDLQAVAMGNMDTNYILMNDIDASDTANWNDAATNTTALEGLRPIGTYSYPLPDTTSFRGVFEGNNHKIIGLTINRPGTDYVGLFGKVGAGGVVRDLSLEGGVTMGRSFVGALVGFGADVIQNCHSSGTVMGSDESVGGLVGCGAGTITDSSAAGAVTGNAEVGGLAGNGGSTIRNCHAAGAVTSLAAPNNGSMAGGLIGNGGGTVVDCYATGAVTGPSDKIGGLVGVSGTGTITNCYATGAVTGLSAVGGLVGCNEGSTIAASYATGNVTGLEAGSEDEEDIGGLVGYNNGTITGCHATGTVAGYSYCVGGLVGANYTPGSIAKSFATGAVAGSAYVGGLAGFNGGSTTRIANCYATGAVSGSPYVGGLVGRNYYATVTNCYATGPVTSSASRVGGLIGDSTAGTITASFWDIQTSRQTASSGGSGRTTDQMKNLATFGGWDFSTLWGIVENQSYPYLSTTPPHFLLDVTIQGNGTADATPDTGVYDAGAVVALTAAPASGKIFIGWAGGVADPLSTTTTVVMDSHKSVTARFSASYEIRTLGELQAIASGDLAANYSLMNDIDASDTANWNDSGTSTSTLEGFLPIGTGTAGFKGLFNGNGHKITGLTIKRPTTSDLGLFGRVSAGGVVRDIALVGGTAMGDDSVGGLVGYANGCSVASSSYTAGTVTGTTSVGGLIGYNSWGTVKTSCAAGTVTGNWSVGGLIGMSQVGTISTSFGAGTVTGLSGVGGLIGDDSYGMVANSYATAHVVGSAYVAGLIGHRSEGSLTTSYAAGSVTGSGSFFEICGLAGGNSSAITSCYWDTDSTGRTFSVGGTGKTTAQMKQQGTFLPAGTQTGQWDFTSVWDIQGSYPFLRAFATHTLTYTAGAHGSVDGLPVAPQTVNDGVSGAPVTAIPDSISHFVRWSDGSTANPRTDSNVTADLSVTATFAVNLYHLAYALTGSGSLDGVTSQTVVQGTSGTSVRAIPDAGWYFVGWSDGSTANPRTDANVVANVSVTVRFVPYTPIRTIADLQAVATGDLTATYVLMNDIDASGTAAWNDAATTTATLEGFRPIGTSSSRFVGLFDGGGHKITGLTMMRTTTDYVGLFGFVGAGGVVRNVRLEGGTVYGRSYVGALAGSCDTAAITSCGITANVRGYSSYVGGLIGASRATTFANCFDTGSVTGFSSYVGGLVGYNTVTPGAMTNCFTSGAVFGSSYAGGLVGYNYNAGLVANCYAAGTVSGSSVVGGLVGYHYGGTLATCYASGAVTCSSSPGGLIGSRPSGTVTACYWDTQTTKQSASAGGTGKTTAQMKQQATYLPTGTGAGQWNFTGIWGIQGTYPYLRSLLSHTLTYTAAANGTVDGATPELQTVNHGGRGTPALAMPATGYHFVRWSDGSANPRQEANVVADLSVTASFAINQYHLAYAAGANGSLTGATSQTLNYGGNGTQITAVPNTDYHFVQWSDGVLTSARTDLAVASNITVTATFAFNAYTLTYLAATHGTIAGTTPQAVPYGADATTVTATADPGYHFVQWSDGVMTAARRDLNASCDFTVTASFAINYYSLAYAAGTGGTLTGTLSQSVAYGQSGTPVRAVAGVAWRFGGWSDGATANPRTDTNVAGNVNVAAQFLPDGQITTLAELQAIATGNMGRTYYLMNDIDASETATWNDNGTTTALVGFKPIGDSRGYSFYGVFEGNGHKIVGLTIHRPSASMVGLFGQTGPSAIVRNLRLEGGSVSGRNGVGGLVGFNFGAVTSCTATIAVAGALSVGEIVGFNVHDLLGIGKIGTVTNCCATGTVTGTGTSSNVGGLVGTNYGVIANSWASATVTGEGGDFGGLVGGNTASITNCYATGPVAGNRAVGGLVGWNYGGTVKNSYSAGVVTGFPTSIGGLIAGNTTGTVTACYWDTESSSQTISAGGAGKTTAEMKQQATFLPAGTGAGQWNFTSVWGIAGGYPTLRAFPVHTVTYMADANGSVDGATSESQTVNHGGRTAPVLAVPATGYHLTHWSDGSTANPRQDAGVVADATVTASFSDQCALAYTTGPGGSLIGTTSQTLTQGGDGPLVTAVPSAHYHFVKWSDNVLTASRTDLAVAGDIIVTAIFELDAYTVTYLAAAHGSISGLTPQTVGYGTDATTVTATANPGYHFVQWSDGVLATARTDLGVAGDITVTATFAANTYTLTYAAAAHGSISGLTPQTVAYGDNATTVTANANPGYHFVQWSDSVMTATRTDLDVTGDVIVTALFGIDVHSLAYAAGPGGSLTGVTSQTLTYGSNGTEVTAVPSTGYHFVSWSDGVLTAARTDLGVTGDIGVTASFAINRYSLAYAAGPGGSISGVTSQTLNLGGNGTQVTAVPATGYHFVQWSDNVLTAARTDRGVTGDIVVTASFAINRYSLAYAAGPGGSISGVTSQTLNYGGNGTPVTALPAPGYHFVQWSDNVMTAARTDLGVTGDISVTASFAIDLHSILAVAPANQNVAAAAGSASLSVTNAGTGAMDWTAQVTNGADWLTIASGASGSDAGTVVVSFAANTGAARTGTITLTATSANGAVANSPSSVTVTQAAGDSPAAGAFLARRVKSSHSEKWDAGGAQVVGKDSYSFLAKMQLPAGSLAAISNATTLTLVLGDAVTSGAACVVIERPLSAATKSTLAGHPAAKNAKDPARGGGVTFVELQPNSTKKARVVTIRWTKTGLLTVTVVGTPPLAWWNPQNPANPADAAAAPDAARSGQGGRVAENVADLCDGAQWPEGKAAGVAVPVLVELSGIVASEDQVTCAGRKSVKPSDGGDLVGWSVSGR